jgi:hypothetical protein
MFEHMRSRDPEGFVTRPTAVDYADFAAWAIATYGAEALRTYRTSSWDV